MFVIPAEAGIHSEAAIFMLHGAPPQGGMDDCSKNENNGCLSIKNKEKGMNKLAILPLVLILIAFSCTPGAKPPPAPGLAPSVISAPVAGEPWQEQWEKTLREAKKQRKVVIYTTLGSDTITVLRQDFMKKFGIDAEFIGGRGPEVAQRILSERRAGIYLVDIYQGGANTAIVSLKPGNALDPMEAALILPEVTDPKVWVNAKIEFVDRDGTIFPYQNYVVPPLAFNTNLVKPEDIKSYRDLLVPRWKGKMTLQDPTQPGAGINWFGIVSELILNIDYMHELVKQEPLITRDRRIQVEWLAQGKYPIAIAAQHDILGNFEREGAPIKKHIPVEGAHTASGSANIALINKAPHPDAAKVYLNWLLGREAQTLHSKTNLLPSARMDVPVDHLDSSVIVQPGVKYYRSTVEDFILRDPQRSKAAQEVFVSLMR